MPSPIAVGNFFFVVSDNGIGTCYDAKTGKIEWQQRMGRGYSASLTSDGKNIYFLDDDGITKVIAVKSKYEVVAVNKLDEPTYASPAISRGQLFIRGDEHLFCIGSNTAQAAR